MAEAEGEEVEVVGVVVALQGHPEHHSQADHHLDTKVIGVEFTTIIQTVPLL